MIASTLITAVVSAQDIDTVMHTPFGDWQLNLVTLTVTVMFLGRIYSYLRRNGGIRSIGHAIWEGGVTGENTPRQLPGAQLLLEAKQKRLEEITLKLEDKMAQVEKSLSPKADCDQIKGHE